MYENECEVFFDFSFGNSKDWWDGCNFFAIDQSFQIKKKEYKIKMLIGVHKLKCLSTNFYPFCILVVRQIRKSPLINQILQSDGNNCRLHECGWTEQGEHRMYLW